MGSLHHIRMYKQIPDIFMGCPCIWSMLLDLLLRALVMMVDTGEGRQGAGGVVPEAGVRR